MKPETKPSMMDYRSPTWRRRDRVRTKRANLMALLATVAAIVMLGGAMYGSLVPTKTAATTDGSGVAAPAQGR